jgi:ferredoxin
MVARESNMRVFMSEFSGTGNTRYLGAVLEHTLKAAGHTVTRVPIEREPLRPVVPQCDLVLVGAPVYHCAPPSNVIRYLDSLAGRGLPLATYFSLGLYSGDCARILQTHAEYAGFRPIGNFEARFPGSDMVAIACENSALVRLNRRIARGLSEKARRFAAELNPNAQTCKPKPKWYVPLNDLANRLAVPAYRRYKERLEAEPDSCAQGYWCVANCPVRAIRPQDKAVTFDPQKCIFCLRCYHGCPHGAIRIADTADKATYPGPQIARNFEPVPEFEPTRAWCVPRASR